MLELFITIINVFDTLRWLTYDPTCIVYYYKGCYIGGYSLYDHNDKFTIQNSKVKVIESLSYNATLIKNGTY